MNKILKEIIKEYKENFNESAVIADCKFIHFRATQTYYNDKFHKKNEKVITIEIMGC